MTPGSTPAGSTRYRTFDKTGWGVSAVGLGTWNLGNQWGELDDETAARIVRSAFDTGVDLFDVAEPYGIPSGTSELCLGRALDDIRDRLRGHAPAGRLGTDYVDLMLRHEGDIEDPSTYVDVLERFYEEPSGDCAAVEVNYSPVNRSPEEDLLELRMEHDPGVLVRGPPARGLLAGKHDRDTEFTGLIRQAWNEGGDRREEFLEKLSTLERIQEALGPDEQLVPTALRYAMSHPVDPVVIPGATSPARAVENATVGGSTARGGSASGTRGNIAGVGSQAGLWRGCSYPRTDRPPSSRRRFHDPIAV